MVRIECSFRNGDSHIRSFATAVQMVSVMEIGDGLRWRCLSLDTLRLLCKTWDGNGNGDGDGDTDDGDGDGLASCCPA